MNSKIITSVEILEAASSGPICSIDEAHCLTCSDEALPAKVLQVDETLALAQVEINGQVTEIDISLVDGVEVGQMLLVHGGVALERLVGGGL